MKEITVLNQNAQGVLVTWPEQEPANRYRLEYLTDTFTYQLVAYSTEPTYFIPSSHFKSNRSYRVRYIWRDEASNQEFLLETTANFTPQPLDRISLQALKSYEGGALSFYAEAHYDLYRVYRQNSRADQLDLLVETEDCHVTGDFIQEGENYQVEGYKKTADGHYTLVAMSDPSVCQFRTQTVSDQPKLSVVVPVYNCQDFLSRTVDSILLSSFRDLEVLLVNDGSSDQSGQICDWYQEQYANVTAIHQANGGVCRARNRGMDEARGEFLAFVDNDDLVHPYMYQKLYDALQDQGTDIAIAQTLMRTDLNEHRIVLQAGGLKDDVTTQTYAQMIDNKNKGNNKNIYFVAIWNKIVRTAVARQVRFLDEIPYYEDTAYTSSLYTYVDRLTMVKGAYYIWDKRKQKTVGTATTTTYKKLPAAWQWHNFILTLLAPLFQGNITDPEVFKLVSFDLMKKLLETYGKQKTQPTKNIFSGLLKYYVREYQISLDAFRDSEDEKLQTLYSHWQEIESLDVAESNGWDELRRLKQEFGG